MGHPMNSGEELMKKMQHGFPLTRYPLRSIAKKSGLNERELIKKIRRWISKGLVRYLGITFDTRKLGVASTLIAMAVDKASLKKVVSCINGYPQVTHNYLRDDDEYNLWFTLSASSGKELNKLKQKIKTETGIAKVMDLPQTSVFKRWAVFS